MKIEDIEGLKYYLQQFREKTIEIINLLEHEEYDKLDEALNKREEIIKSITQIHSDSDVFKGLCVNLKIIPLEQKLNSILNSKKSEIQKELNKISNKTSANKNYNKSFSVDSLYLSKKV
ncbi:hypothetical protein SDC9_148529 [bioreactor metagenome]|uniref:Flagellar protein FliT n=1 Tax=bioreactor metagenome TaxID=1076179 RepID=A0A645EJ12_9ZZZZ